MALYDEAFSHTSPTWRERCTVRDVGIDNLSVWLHWFTNLWSQTRFDRAEQASVQYAQTGRNTPSSGFDFIVLDIPIDIDLYLCFRDRYLYRRALSRQHRCLLKQRQASDWQRGAPETVAQWWGTLPSERARAARSVLLQNEWTMHARPPAKHEADTVRSLAHFVRCIG